MNAKKLTYWIWGTLIGTFVLIVAMVLVWKFRFYDATVTQLATANTNYGTKAANAKKLEVSLKAALLAKQKLDLASGELLYFRTRYRSLPMDLQPNVTLGDGPRDATFARYQDEYFVGFGINARQQLIRAADESGVQINTNIKVETPPQNPEEVNAPASGFLKPQTGPLDVTITGTLDNILNFFQIINHSEILMTVSTIKLEGTSPAIKASFTLTPYLLVSGPSATQGAIPGIEAAQVGAAPAAAAPANGAGTGAGGEPSVVPVAAASPAPPPTP